MRITDALIAEHKAFTAIFDQIENELPRMSTLAEVRLAARLVEGALAGHADAEENLAFVALDHVLRQNGKLDRLYEDHHELDDRLLRLQRMKDFGRARQSLELALAAARRHFTWEEDVVFPLCERVLQHETLERLGRAWQDEAAQNAWVSGDARTETTSPAFHMAATAG